MICIGKNPEAAAIDSLYENYKSLIERVDNSYRESIKHLEAEVHSIEGDDSLDAEEIATGTKLYYDAICDLRYQSERSQSVLFCAIYSFWEKSLYELCKYCKVEIKKRDGSINYAPKISDYLNGLLDEQSRSCIPTIILMGLSELRNYFVHGTLSPQRKKIIRDIFPEGSGFIRHESGRISLKSCAELCKILDLIHDTLRIIQTKCSPKTNY